MKNLFIFICAEKPVILTNTIGFIRLRLFNIFSAIYEIAIYYLSNGFENIMRY